MKKSRITAIISIMSLSFLTMSITATTPALASIGKAFPGIDGSTLILLSTLPALAVVPFSILAGKLAGSKIKFRTLALLGTLIITIAGVLPYFINDFYAILATRAIFGAGAGLIAPLPTTLIMDLFDGNTRENLMGMNNVVMNAGGMAFQMIAGILCAIYWRNTFIVYLICIITLMFVFFFLPEPTKVENKIEDTEIKGGMNAVAYIWISAFVLLVFFTYPFYLNMSSLIEQGNLGTAAVTGLVLTVSTVGGMLASTFFGIVFRFAKRRTVSIGFFFCTVSYIIVIFGNSVVAFTLASLLSGFGMGFIGPAVFMNVGLAVAPATRAFAMSLMMALPNLAMFLTSYFFAFIKSAFNITYNRYIFVIGLAFYMFGAIFFWFVNLDKKRKNEEVETLE